MVSSTPNIGQSTWIARMKPCEQVRARLMAFPYAGGGVAAFREWGPSLPAGVELWGVQLPGREKRLREPPVRELPVVVERISDAIAQTFTDDVPLVLFGHSLGALIGYEVARHLRRRGERLPRLLMVSGRMPPQLASRGPALHLLGDELLLREIQRLDGVPAEVASNREMVALIMPALRADLVLDETYVYAETSEPPLDCAMLAFGGREDPEVTIAQLAHWRVHTSSTFAVRPFPGGHFFFRTHADLFLTELGAALSVLIQQP